MNTSELTARLIVDYSLIVLWTAVIVAVVWHGLRILADLVARANEQPFRMPPPGPYERMMYPPPPPPDDWNRP